jgi:hypothetical protein
MTFQRTPTVDRFMSQVRTAFANDPADGRLFTHKRSLVATAARPYWNTFSKRFQKFLQDGILAPSTSAAHMEYVETDTWRLGCLWWREQLASTNCCSCVVPLRSYRLLDCRVPVACSPRCVGKSKLIWEKRKTTYREKTGYDYASQDPAIKTRKVQSSRAHFGCDNPSQSEVVKEQKRNTNITRRGVDNPAKDPKVQAKTVQTNWARYGAPYHILSRRVVEGSAICGGYKLYSYQHRGRTFRVQGKAELALLPLLISKHGAKNVLTQYDKKFCQLQSRTYSGFWADFYLKNLQCFVEVKSLWTFFCGNSHNGLEVNTKKAKVYQDSMRWIVHLTHNRDPSVTPWVVLPKNWHTLSPPKLLRLFPDSTQTEIRKYLAYKEGAV